MSNKPHYFAIGVFVLAATVLALVGVIAFSSDAMRSPKYFLETYVDESVQGIDVGTPFKFRGVKIGNVSEIVMVSTEYKTEKMYVMIRVALNDKEMLEDAESIPERVREQVKNGLRMKLVPQGITGLSFLEAEYYPDTESRPLFIDWEPKYTYIPSTPAMMTLLSRTIERLAAELDTLDIEAIGNNVETLTSNLSVTVQNIGEITRNAAGASEEVVGNLKVAVADLPSVTSNLNDTVLSLGELVGESDRDVQEILNNLRYITDDTRELIRMLKRYPGMLLAEPPDKNLSREGTK
jgi:phospholipid/cholesterol/gamma-HCH transport system substrate-binding protein/paraquat-inducible protein B